MPADQQRLNVLLDEQLGELIRRPGDVVEISSEVTAGVSVEPAGARMDVNVDGAHGKFINLDYKIAQEFWTESLSKAHGKFCRDSEVSRSKLSEFRGRVMKLQIP